MIHIKTVAGAFLLISSLWVFSGCSAQAEPAGVDLGDVTIQTVTEADPQAAVDEIYKSLPDARPQWLTDYMLEEKLPDASEVVESYYGAISNPNGGLADVIILDPQDGMRDQVRDALNQYKDRRMKEFENYDILGAFGIAQEALVFDQGDYVILLMLPDLEAAQDILDRHLPL